MIEYKDNSKRPQDADLNLEERKEAKEQNIKELEEKYNIDYEKIGRAVVKTLSLYKKDLTAYGNLPPYEAYMDSMPKLKLEIRGLQEKTRIAGMDPKELRFDIDTALLHLRDLCNGPLFDMSNIIDSIETIVGNHIRE